MSVVKWKIDGVEVSINPTGLTRVHRSGAVYQQLTDGSEVRISTGRKPRVSGDVWWSSVSEEQLEFIRKKLDSKVSIIDHTGRQFEAYIDDIEEVYIERSGPKQRYEVRLTIKEV